MAKQSTPPRKTFGTRHRTMDDKGEVNRSDDQYLRIADEAYQTSTSFVDNNYRTDWENSIRHFQGKHMLGSKYLTDAYKYRSKNFRPKTRAIVRQNEAAAAAAFFSQIEVITIEPVDETDQVQKASAEFRHELLNYRLKNDIPWFPICIGAMQTANVYGVVCSKQYWEFEEETVQVPLQVNGQQVYEAGTNKPAMVPQTRKLKDRPTIQLWPVENLRFDPGADWTDVVNSSPYFIAITPMYVQDVRAKIDAGEWEKVDDKVLMQARNAVYDTTRQQREGEKEDPRESRYSAALSDFDTVWVHENFIRRGRKELHYYTLGTIARLSKVRPIKDVYLHGIRPFVMGTCMIEANRVMPDSPVHLAKGLQKEANEISNSRQDNVKLVLNKRYLVRRGKQVDLQSLVRNAAGSVTLVNDTESDVREMEFNDVTQSAFQEQSRVDIDTDELLGSFSPGTVQTNRSLNETVGGLSMIRGTSNQMTQYLIRVFTETWVEKVIGQVDLLEQHYESDEAILTLIAKRAHLPEKYGFDEITSEFLMQPATITVNVANSAMDPVIRLELFMKAIQLYAEFSQIAPSDMDREAIKAQVFGLLGYRDGRQFSVDPENGNPQLAAAMQQIAELTRQLEGKYAEAQAKEEGKMAIESAKLQQKSQFDAMSLAADERRAEMEMALQNNQAASDARLQVFLAQIKADSDDRIQAMQLQAEADRAEADRRLQLLIAQMGEQTNVIVARITAANKTEAA